jgi:Methyltransferase FkbM domain
MNDLEKYAGLFDDIEPWSGTVPAGCIVDFLGTVTAKEFLGPWGHHPLFFDGNQLTVPRPTLDGVDKNCEFWFEAADWVLAAREARERFVMVTLGALYGYQAVGSHRALQRLNPMPAKLVAVEPIPQNMEWVKRHMLDNGIDPDAHWLIQAAISDCNEPVFFPVGSPGLGAQNCVATNEKDARRRYFEEFVAQGRTEEALRNLLLRNTTGMEKDIIAGHGHMGEIKLISSVTLDDILGPFSRVDFLEADIQESEIVVFPPFIDLLKRKVRRIHVGTHGANVHRAMHDLFAGHGWEIVFSFAPETAYETSIGGFRTNDGILSVVNPALRWEAEM